MPYSDTPFECSPPPDAARRADVSRRPPAQIRREEGMRGAASGPACEFRRGRARAHVTPDFLSPPA
jgi:hypothetical protein